MENGANMTRFDALCHKVFSGGRAEYRKRGSGLSCARCGCELDTYYCEEGLVLVECSCCEVKALVKAQNVKQACYSSGLAWPVYSLDAMGEAEGVFFAHTPIDEPPVYAGALIDADFPFDDVVRGMPLPCPATDGCDIVKEDDE